MKQILYRTFVCTGVFLCVQPWNAVLAQVPGGAPLGQAPSTPPTFPGQPSSNPSPGNNPTGANGPTGVHTPDAAATSSKADDQQFVKEAAMGGMTEVKLGRLAMQKASREEVKQFGRRMVDDHTKANDQLKQIASKENISMSGSLDAEHQSRIDKLSKLSGTDFDKAYLKDQLEDHQTDVKEFRTEAQSGTDPNIKAFASDTLPTLQEHLEMVRRLNKSEKAAQSTKPLPPKGGRLLSD